MSKTDDKIICCHCGRRIVPRISFRYGEPYRSWCPFCKARVDEEDIDTVPMLILVSLVIAAYYVFWD